MRAESEHLFSDVKKILVLKLRNIGDVLLTVPAIRALKEAFPGARISVLVNSGTEDMLTLNPLVEEVLVFRRSVKGLPAASRVKEELEFAKLLRKRRFDMTVDLTGGDRPAILSLFSGARYRLGYEPKGGFFGKKLLYTHLAPRPSRSLHTVLRDLGVPKAFGMDTRDLTVDIYSYHDDESFVEKVLKDNGIDADTPFVHVHPTSRWFFKCWNDASMARVLDWIAGEGFKVVLTTGPAEKELKKAAAIISLMKTSPVDLSGSLSLKRLAALSRRAAFFFGVDTAPMHIAAATGTRVVALFGPSGSFDWGPWDNAAACAAAAVPYPERNGEQAFGRNIVIQRRWDCVPCGKDGCNGSKKSDCLEDIGAEEVERVLSRIITEVRKTA